MYLSFGFKSTGGDRPRLEFVVCGQQLSNKAIVPSKLKCNLYTKHANLKDKPLEYFKIILFQEAHQVKFFTKHVSISDKAQETNYAVTEIVARKIKTHTTAKSIILPPCSEIRKIIMGDGFKKTSKEHSHAKHYY